MELNVNWSASCSSLTYDDVLMHGDPDAGLRLSCNSSRGAENSHREEANETRDVAAIVGRVLTTVRNLTKRSRTNRAMAKSAATVLCGRMSRTAMIIAHASAKKICSEATPAPCNRAKRYSALAVRRKHECRRGGHECLTTITWEKASVAALRPLEAVF